MIVHSTVATVLLTIVVFQVCLAIDEVDNVTRQVAVEFLHRPFNMQQHIKALVDRELWHPGAVELSNILIITV